MALDLVGEGEGVDVPHTGTPQSTRGFCERRACCQYIVDEQNIGASDLLRIRDVERAADILGTLGGIHRSRLNGGFPQSDKCRNGCYTHRAREFPREKFGLVISPLTESRGMDGDVDDQVNGRIPFAQDMSHL